MAASTHRTRPLRALVRVVMAPGFVLALWVAQLLVARLLASPARAAAGAAMAEFRWFDDGHRLRALIELFADSPAVPATIAVTVAGSAIVGGVFSLVAAPAILTRLDGQRGLGWLAAAVGRELPAMLVQTFYGLVFRVLCTGLAGAAAGLLGPGGLPVALILASFPIVVLDRARAAVVLDDDRPFHPMTFLRAIGRVARRPLWWLSGAAIEGLRLALVLGTVALVIAAGPSSAAIWIARAAGLAALGLGLWRVSLAVDERAPV